MTRSLRALLAGAFACLLCASPASLLAQAIDSEPYPLEPPNTASPQDTFRSFLRYANDAVQSWRADEDAPLINDAARRAMRCLDLSELPPAVRDDLGLEKVLLLKEILDRIEVPDFEEIPGQEQVAADEDLDSWVVPHTELTIARIAEGPLEGEFLFSASTVRQLEHFYALSEHLPYKPNATIGIYEEIVRSPGPWIPRNWVGALPSWSTKAFLGEAAWQWIALGLTLALFAFAMTACYVWARRWDNRRRRTTSQVGKILFVIALIGLTRLLAAFVENGINVSGRPLIIVEFVLDVIAFAAGGWLIALVLTLIGETIIRTQRLRQGAINSQLIRICFRLLTIIVLLYLAIAAAEAFGVPVAPLLASLGVGGLAIALAVRPTLENILGGFTLFADKPVRVGDFCLYGDKQGTVEEIGLRSTRIRSLQRTVVTVPNAEFSQMQLENFTRRDRMLFRTTLGLRYETTPEQLRYALAKLRELLLAHPMVSPDPARVRFVGFGDYSLDVEIFAYVLSADYNAYLGVLEDLNLRIMDIVEESGTGFAFPSQTTYLTRDKPLDAERAKAAEGQVEQWRRDDALPFPEPDPARRQELAGTLDFPPKGSASRRAVAEPTRAAPTRRSWRGPWRAAE
ncbi:MAG TPA: mechanosensitive ion channel family protein [Geminicoccaceae bacterium]|nr:mechanosensitive ion channel family protein [Geminicoccaceae bacterium]